ncbi:hypothetical protein OWM54_16440 [Myxococcus sp. MISCRS1]|uniref:hypothetical protein n=1 Tax=Myxococcus sp. MISCRS1 TaxID=2996786 RepID=UPI002271B559|nr:hypothetical protein [Myxococcus sp. MISCRS1]MCY0998729.1 hypothetical protein [Myxococcus sp. MISCRS1]
MERRLLVVGVIAGLVLGACAPRGVRPVPPLGSESDVRTRPGTYDGYSVKVDFKQVARHQGHVGEVVVTGLGDVPLVMTLRRQGDDALERRLAPGLRIEHPVMMAPQEPSAARDERVRWRVEGLDYEYLRKQGWLFEGCQPDFQPLCELGGTALVTSSFQAVDALVAYLGHWMTEGHRRGSILIEVWAHLGTVDQVKTRMGAQDGYTVAWCKLEESADHRLLVLTGQGARVFAPLVDGEPEAIEQRGNAGVVIGAAGTERGFTTVSRPGCHAPYAAWVDVHGYGQVDAAIAWWGRRLKEGDHAGEVLLRVSGPELLILE